MEQQDLNAEYGRIFGVVHYPTLLIRMIRHTANFVKKSLIHLGCLPRQISCHLKASTIFLLNKKLIVIEIILNKNRVILTYMMSLLGLGIMSQQLLPASYLF